MGRVKVFVLYHKRAPMFRSDCFEPLQTGCANATEALGLLRDDDGENISEKNDRYAELTGNYWVWKNYLPQHPEIEYVGFCHYRRFLDFWKRPVCDVMPFGREMSFARFEKRFASKYTESNILRAIGGFDIVVPSEFSTRQFGRSNYVHYLECGHPQRDLDRLVEIIARQCPEYMPEVTEYLQGDSGYYCLNYLMRRELFESFMRWWFPLVDELVASSDWSGYVRYEESKVPAFLAERFFNVWLRHEGKRRPLRKLSCDGVVLSDRPEPTWLERWRDFCGLVGLAFAFARDGSIFARLKRRIGYFIAVRTGKDMGT